jgi:hypothetical protein
LAAICNGDGEPECTDISGIRGVIIA